MDAVHHHVGGQRVVGPGGVEDAGRAVLGQADHPLAQVAAVDDLDRVIAVTRHQDLPAFGDALGPVREAVGLIARADEFFGNFTDGSILLSQFVSLPQVLAFSAIVAILNLVVVTVLGAVLAGIYNLAVKVTGGLLVGFTSN